MVRMMNVALLILSMLGIASMLKAQATLIKATSSLLDRLKEPVVNVNIVLDSDSEEKKEDEFDESMVH